VAEFQANQVLYAFASATSDQSSALQSLFRAQSYVALFFDRLTNLDPDTGLGDVNAAAVDEFINAPVIVPDKINGRRFRGSRMTAGFMIPKHSYAPVRIQAPTGSYIILRANGEPGYGPKVRCGRALGKRYRR
jgi:hypothetical protein